MLQEAKEVCPTSTRRLLNEGATLIDVRDTADVAECAFDVPGVINIPLSELEQRWSEVPRDHPVVFACDSGVRSLKATYFLQYQGYTNVCNMSGGILKWSAKGFPITGVCATISQTNSGCCSTSQTTKKSSCCSHTAPSASCC